MSERIETADDLTEEQLDLIAETEAELDAIQRRIDAGEKIDMHGWDKPNWINKVTPALDCDAKIDGKETRGILCDVCGEVIQPEQLDLQKRLSVLEFEIRYETDFDEMAATGREIDAVRRKLKKMKCHS